jgi:hypothetical protein
MKSDKTEIFYCEKTDSITPGESRKGKMTFWRIPTDCPRPETEVERSENPQPKSEWETLDYLSNVESAHGERTTNR